MEIIFSERARKEWSRLERSVQNQLRKKIEFYLQSGQPLKFAEKLKDSSLGEYRFRIGDYRIVFDLEGNTIFVLRVGHRKEIYKKNPRRGKTLTVATAILRTVSKVASGPVAFPFAPRLIYSHKYGNIRP